MLQGGEGYMYGSEFCSEDDVVFIDASSVDEDGCVCGFVYNRGAQFGVGVYFRAISVHPGVRVPHGRPRGGGRGSVWVMRRRDGRDGRECFKVGWRLGE